MTFNERYLARLTAVGTRLCIGLDTDVDWLPEECLAESNPILAFNRKVIAVTHEFCVSYKMNLAFYESQGKKGYEALEGTLDAIPDGVITIGDAKRGDIGNTAAHYARAMFESWGFDATTVNPYMGTDTLEPYFEHGPRGVFVLGLTSNPGSQEFQRREVDGRPLYQTVIETCLERFGASDQIGFVVGATHPAELRAVRDLIGADVPALIPGIGAQGGDIDLTVEANNGGHAFINVSRGVIKPGGTAGGGQWIDDIREAAISYKELLGAADPFLKESTV